MNDKIIALGKFLLGDIIEYNGQYYYGITEEEIIEKEGELTEEEFLEWLDTLSLLENEIKEEGDNYFAYGKEEYLVLDEDEAYDRAYRSVMDLWEDAYVTKEMRDSFLYNYIDFETATEDVIKADGIGHILASYDGEENESDGYFIYRVN